MRHSLLCSLALVVVLVPGGCGGGGGSGAPAPAAAGVTIDGNVIDAAGFAVPNVGVAILGHGLQVTPADGAFSFSGIGVPYTAVVIASGTGVPRITVYEGLTRPDPTLVATSGGGLTYSGTVDGAVTGGGAGIPSPANHAVALHVEMLAPARPGSTTNGSASPVSGVFASLPMAWAGSPDTNVRVHALQYEFEPVGNMPIAFKGFGSAATPLAHGQAVGGLDITMQPATTTAINGLVEADPGYDLVSRIVALELPTGPLFRHTTELDPPLGFTYFVPEVGSFTHMVGVVAQSTNGGRITTASVRGISSGAIGVPLVVPRGPEALFPPNGALGIDLMTPFESEAIGGGVYRFEIDSATSPRYVIYSASPVVFLPDLSPYGIASLGSGAEYAWWPILEGPSTTVDELAGPDGLAPTAYTFHARGPSWTFTAR